MIRIPMAGWKQTLPVFHILILSLFLALGTMVSTSAALATEIKIPALRARPGQLLEVPIMVDEVDNLAGVKLVLKYDPRVLKFKNGKKTRQTDSLMHIVNDKKPGLLIIVMAGARGIKGREFSIFTLSFAVKTGLKGNHTTTISITEAQLMSDKLKTIKCRIAVYPITILPAEEAGAGVHEPE